MLKSELVIILCNKFPELTEADVALSIQTILDSMTRQLMQGGRIEIRRFGSLRSTLRAARISRNPKTGEKVQVGDRISVRFKPSLEFRKKV